jgi:hypothetical protein
MLAQAARDGLDTAHNLLSTDTLRREELGFLPVGTALEPRGLGNRCPIPLRYEGLAEAQPHGFPGICCGVAWHSGAQAHNSQANICAVMGGLPMGSRMALRSAWVTE